MNFEDFANNFTVRQDNLQSYANMLGKKIIHNSISKLFAKIR